MSVAEDLKKLTPEQLREKRVELLASKMREDRQAKRLVDAEEQPPTPVLKAYTVEELFAQEPPDYLIDALLPEAALAELVGDSETLKSFIAIHMAMCIASGKHDCFGMPVVKHGPVLYIAAEGQGTFQYRLRAWGTDNNVDTTKVPIYTITSTINLRDPHLQETLKLLVSDIKPVLIIVDTLHRCIPGAEENSSRDLGEAVSFATQIKYESGATVLFIHHPPKSTPGGRGRGSGALYNAADSEINSVLEGTENPDGTKVITVSVKKQKGDQKVSFTLKNRIVQIYDRQGRAMAYASGRAITSCVLDLATEDDCKEAAVKSHKDTMKQIIAFVGAHPGSNVSEIRAGIKGKKQVVSDLVKELELKKELKKNLNGSRHEYHLADANADVPAPDEEKGAPCDI